MKRVIVKLSDFELVACYGAVGFFFFLYLMFYMPTMFMSLSVYVFLSISVTVMSLIIWLCLAFASGKLGLFFLKKCFSSPFGFLLFVHELFVFLHLSFQRLYVIVHCIWVHNVKTHNRSAGYVFERSSHRAFTAVPKRIISA